MKKRSIIASLFFGGCFIALSLSGQVTETDAVFLSLSREYRLNEDGSMEYRYSKEQKLLTHFAFHSVYGETFVIYDPRYQELHINEAYTVMADGRKVVTPANAFNEVLPRFASNFPAASHLREMVITHTGLEVGAVIHLDYTIKTANDFFPALMAKEILVTSSPVEQQTITVDIPANEELYHKTVHIRSAPEIRAENGRKRYTWTFTRLDAKPQEPFQPDDIEYLPALFFSTAGNLYLMMNALASQDAFLMETNPDMKGRIGLISEQQPDPLNRIREIQKLVVDEFNLFDVPPEFMGYRLRTPVETWQSNGGTEIEKCVMMAALLREAGFRAGVCAVIPRIAFDKSIGCFPVIKGFVVEVSSGDDVPVILSARSMSDQSQISEFAANALAALDHNAESLRVCDVPDQEAVLKADFQVTIDDTGRLSGSVTAVMASALNPYPGLRHDENILKGHWTAFACSGNVKSVKVLASSADQSSAVWDLASLSPLKEQDGYYFLELPVYKNGFSNWQIMYLNPSRISPVRIPYPVTETYVFSIGLPENLSFVRGLEPVNITNEAGSITIEMTSRNKSVLVSKSIRLNDRINGSQQLGELRELINGWNDMNNLRIILKRTE